MRTNSLRPESPITRSLLIASSRLLVVCGLFSVAVTGQILPLRNFTIADGLAHNGITDILQDETGYLWVGTAEGLSRFDGYAFKNYGGNDGLTSPYINDISIDRTGRMWVGINDGGIAMFINGNERHPEPGRKFISYAISDLPRAKNVGQIVFDVENRMWCATEGGVFRARDLDIRSNQFEPVTSDGAFSRAAFADSRGRLWFGLKDRVLMVEKGTSTYFTLDSDQISYVTAITEDSTGRLLLSTTAGLYEFSEAMSGWRRLALSLPPDQTIGSLEAGADGAIRMGTNRGLIEYRGGGQQQYTKDNGLTSAEVGSVFTDRDGGIWIGTRGGGLGHLRSNAIVTYIFTFPGKPHRIDSDRDGNIYIQSGCQPEATRISRVTPSGIVPVVVPEIRIEGCSRNRFLKTSGGEWWFTSRGILQIFDGPSDATGIPVRLPDGSLVEDLVTMYEDNAERVWLSGGDRNLYVAKLGRGKAPTFEVAARNVGASMLLHDSRGVTWLANNVSLSRIRDGVLEEITEIPLVSKIQPRALFEDSRGRIWIGTRFDGLVFTDQPSAPVPEFGKIGASEGLGSGAVWSIAEDDAGMMYFGTGRGLVRYDSANNSLRRFTGAADSVPESAVNDIFKDADGMLWIASELGVLRIDPRALDKNMRPPPVIISRITVEDADLALPENGVSELTVDDFASNQNSVSIEFVGLNLRGEGSLNYQYLLEGHDDRWSTPNRQREVNFANLGAGSYRFLVKAIDQRGIESESPAVLQFQILPPFWQRWWFLGLASAAIVLALYGLYRYRMTQVIELERVRTRIATDLHDDIGANLTRIALMSEVLNQEGSNGSARTMLPSIANIARESVASMNDIVWAISPEHDRVLDLTRRMRQHAEEVFTFRDIDVDFVSGSTDSELKLPVGVRRDVLLIFKEAVSNAARHSGCTQVTIEFSCTSSRLHLLVADNGRGFAVKEERAGHGLSSMSRRGTALGGKLEIRSGESGTAVELEITL